ncbi:hypothetical protein [Enterovirga sp. CN4-39]|uniref:hypothetical protein n=1 Tax=Enterovirga sp. CN4-39 TaxID=3400910 RepID=UPI003C0C35A2
MDERPSLSVFEALLAAPDEVFFVLVLSFWDSADPAADLLFDPVDPLLSVLDADDAALGEVVFPAIVILLPDFQPA